MVASAQVLERNLRALRRYASILTGSKATGDELILMCLERIAETEEHKEPGFDRVDLFRHFHDVVSDVGYCYDASSWQDLHRDETQVLRRLAALADLDRGILLLRKIEWLSYDEIADIVRLPLDDIVPRLVDASKTMRELEHHSVLIIEDEFLIARDLWRIVEDMGHSVCGVAGNADVAITLAASEKPTLVLADLRLADGQFSGIDAARMITSSADIPIVFVTAYPEQAARTFASDPYIVRKPFHPATIAAAVNCALAQHIQGRQ